MSLPATLTHDMLYLLLCREAMSKQSPTLRWNFQQAIFWKFPKIHSWHSPHYIGSKSVTVPNFFSGHKEENPWWNHLLCQFSFRWDSRRQCLHIRSLCFSCLPWTWLGDLGDAQIVKDHREDSSYYEYLPSRTEDRGYTGFKESSHAIRKHVLMKWIFMLSRKYTFLIGKPETEATNSPQE